MGGLRRVPSSRREVGIKVMRPEDVVFVELVVVNGTRDGTRVIGETEEAEGGRGGERRGVVVFGGGR